MAEIKSTLDLVLERTRHLRLSPGEKRAQQQVQLGRSLAGVVQRCADGVLRLDAARQELRALERSSGFPVLRPLVEAILAHLDPEQDDPRLLPLLAQETGVALQRLVESVERLRAQLDTAGAERQADIATTLLQRRGIGGSSLVVNLGADTEWARRRASITAAWRQRLAEELERPS
jgi:hypothetical protein